MYVTHAIRPKCWVKGLKSKYMIMRILVSFVAVHIRAVCLKKSSHSLCIYRIQYVFFWPSMFPKKKSDITILLYVLQASDLDRDSIFLA